MLQLTSQQGEAIRKWIFGMNVCISAVPGAGKTRVIIEACKARTNSLILAYNSELKEATQKIIDEMDLSDQVICLTFHGLCTRCIQLASDDEELFQAIDKVQKGQMDVQKLNVSTILIDEAQDFRASFWTLMNLTINITPNTQFMIVGDEKQMLYDYSEEDAANLDFITHPSTFIHSTREWIHVYLTISHRLTFPMVHFINTMFECAIQHNGQNNDTTPIKIITTNMWKTGPILKSTLEHSDTNSCLVLIPNKKNNRPLRAAINYLSKDGTKIHIHGLDGIDPRIKNGKLRISTWHAAKGTQAETVVVLGVRTDVKVNPFFVALTRSYKRLIIIQDAASPHLDIIKACAALDANVIDMDVCTQKLVVKYVAEGEIVQTPPYEPDANTPILKNVEAWRPTCRLNVSHRILKSPSGLDEIWAGEVACIDQHQFQDVGEIYALACRFCIEYMHTKRIRFVEHIFTPVRMESSKRIHAIKAGHMARFVSPNVCIDTLLPDDLVAYMRYSYKSPSTPRDWCILAAGALAWNEFHHNMRQMCPFEWVDKSAIECGVQYLIDAFGSDTVQFDVQRFLTIDNSTIHARCHAYTPECAWFFVWNGDVSYSNRLQASIHAVLHESNVCRVINLRTGARDEVYIQDRDVFLGKLTVRKTAA